MTNDGNADFSWRVRVYYEDTDAGGIVYHASYLRFFERARTEWMRSLDVPLSALARDHGVQFVVTRLAIDFLLPARLDDMLELRLRPVEVRRASMLLEQQCRIAPDEAPDAQSGSLLARAQVRLAAIRCDDGRPCGLPPWILTRVNA